MNPSNPYGFRVPQPQPPPQQQQPTPQPSHVHLQPTQMWFAHPPQQPPAGSVALGFQSSQHPLQRLPQSIGAHVPIVPSPDSSVTSFAASGSHISLEQDRSQFASRNPITFTGQVAPPAQDPTKPLFGHPSSVQFPYGLQQRYVEDPSAFPQSSQGIDYVLTQPFGNPAMQRLEMPTSQPHIQAASNPRMLQHPLFPGQFVEQMPHQQMEPVWQPTMTPVAQYVPSATYSPQAGAIAVQQQLGHHPFAAEGRTLQQLRQPTGPAFHHQLVAVQPQTLPSQPIFQPIPEDMFLSQMQTIPQFASQPLNPTQLQVQPAPVETLVSFVTLPQPGRPGYAMSQPTSAALPSSFGVPTSQPPPSAAVFSYPTVEVAASSHTTLAFPTTSNAQQQPVWSMAPPGGSTTIIGPKAVVAGPTPVYVSAPPPTAATAERQHRSGSNPYASPFHAVQQHPEQQLHQQQYHKPAVPPFSSGQPPPLMRATSSGSLNLNSLVASHNASPAGSDQFPAEMMSAESIATAEAQMRPMVFAFNPHSPPFAPPQQRANLTAFWSPTLGGLPSVGSIDSISTNPSPMTPGAASARATPCVGFSSDASAEVAVEFSKVARPGRGAAVLRTITSQTSPDAGSEVPTGSALGDLAGHNVEQAVPRGTARSVSRSTHVDPKPSKVPPDAVLKDRILSRITAFRSRYASHLARLQAHASHVANTRVVLTRDSEGNDVTLRVPDLTAAKRKLLSGNCAGSLDLSRISGLTVATVPLLVDCLEQHQRLLYVVTSLALNNNDTLADAGLIALLTHPSFGKCLPNVESLDLISMNLSDAALSCIALFVSQAPPRKAVATTTSPTQRSIRLKLADNRFTAVGVSLFVQQLSGSIRLSASRGEFMPRETLVSDVVETALTATSDPPRGLIVDQLLLGGNPLCDEGVEALTPLLSVSLPPPFRLTCLSIRRVEMTLVGMKALSAALCEHSAMVDLSLRENIIGEAGLIELSRAVEVLPCLVSLDVKDCGGSDVGTEKLFVALLKAKSRIRTLSVAGNRISDRTAEAIAAFLESAASHLTSLDLANCGLSATSLRLIFEVLIKFSRPPCVGCALTTLALDRNSLDNQCVLEVTRYVAARGCSLFTLLLQQCHMTEEGVETLCRGIGVVENRLRALNLKLNFARRRGGLAIAELLRVHQHLCSLEFNDAEIDSESLQTILVALLDPIGTPRLRHITAGGQSRTPPMANELTQSLWQEMSEAINAKRKRAVLRRQLLQAQRAALVSSSLASNATVLSLAGQHFLPVSPDVLSKDDDEDDEDDSDSGQNVVLDPPTHTTTATRPPSQEEDSPATQDATAAPTVIG